MYYYGHSYFMCLLLVFYFIVYLQISQMQHNLSTMHSKNQDYELGRFLFPSFFSFFTLIEMTKISIIQSLRLEVTT